jgi:hypothetical protein
MLADQYSVALAHIERLEERLARADSRILDLSSELDGRKNVKEPPNLSDLPLTARPFMVEWVHQLSQGHHHETQLPLRTLGQRTFRAWPTYRPFKGRLD